MEVEYTFLTQRGTALMHRTQRASADRVQLGRGTDNEIALVDIRVGLRVATLSPGTGGMVIEAIGAAPLQVNGQPVQEATLQVGDEIRIGPYRLEVTAPPEGCDGAIQIELVQPLASATDPVRARARIGLQQTHLNKRATAWTLVLVIAVVGLIVPIVVFASGMLEPWHKDKPEASGHSLVGMLWKPGDFSNSHRFFGENCATCHQGAFSRVADTACESCHTDIAGHIPAGVKLAGMNERLDALHCNDCHTEHRGLSGKIFSAARLCLDCHRELDKSAPGVSVAAVTSFPAGHPQFRATLVADAASQKHVRAELGAQPAPVDHPGMKFSHAAHLVPGGFPTLNHKEIGCADCHVADPSGKSFQPITYNGRCQDCHDLKFDAVSLPYMDARVPHGDENVIISSIRNFYAARALHDGVGTPATSPAVVRGIAGMPAPDSTKAPTLGDVRGWIADQSKSAIALILDPRRGCGYCHYGTGANGAFDTQKAFAAIDTGTDVALKVIAPVELQNRFLPNAVFDHAKHRGMKCEDCHATRTSQSSADVLIPGIETCKNCHGNEGASTQAQSTCITCHAFHRPGFGLMHPTVAAK